MIALIDGVLTVTRNGRAIPIQRLGAQAGVEALLKLGYSIDVAQVFGHGAEHGRVVALAGRKQLLITRSN